MKAIFTPDAPPPAGHYSQAIVHQGLVYVAGQVGADPAGRAKINSVEEETEQALRNIEAVLKAAGSGLDRILQMTVFVTDIALWSAVNATYARVMGDHRPARAVVPIRDLARGHQIELVCIAAAGAKRAAAKPRTRSATGKRRR